VLILGLAGLPALAQNQAPSTSQNSSPGTSLGDYARQVRKDPGTPSKPKVYDNDNLPREDKLSVVGKAREATDNSVVETKAPSDVAATAEPKAATDKAGAEAAQASSASPAPASEDEASRQAAAKQWGEKLASQQDQINLLTRELDVVQREYQIRAAAMYADAGNRMRNSADWDKQDAQYKQQIADKQKALDEAKQKLEDAQEEARKAGVPDSVREP